jgi:hypothetical protein
MKKMSVWFVVALMVVSLLAGCGGGSKVDQVEDLVDEGIALMKKAQSGDLGALEEVAKLEEKLKDLMEELEENEDDLSEAEKERLEKAVSKLMSLAF